MAVLKEAKPSWFALRLIRGVCLSKGRAYRPSELHSVQTTGAGLGKVSKTDMARRKRWKSLGGSGGVADQVGTNSLRLASLEAKIWAKVSKICPLQT